MLKCFFILFFIGRVLFANSDINKSIEKDININKIEIINKLSQNGKLNKAIFLLKKEIKKEPKNIELHLLYAKLLYWNSKLKEAKNEILPYKKSNNALYHNIYTAWAYKELKSIKNPNRRVKFIKRLEDFAQSSYDIRWIYIDSLIKIKSLKKALILNKKLVKKYPKSQEAQERLAQLLFWNSKYIKSLNYYKKLSFIYHKSYKNEKKKLKNIINSREKKVKITKKPHFIKKIKLVKNTKNKHMIGFSVVREHFSDRRYKDLSKFIEVTLPINEYIIYFNIQNTKRYTKEDSKIYAEIYPKLAKPQWGYISLSYSFKSEFFANYSIGWHYFYGWRKWQFGGGAEFSKYSNNSTIALLSLEYSYYLSEFIFFREALFYVPNNGSYAFTNQIKYETPTHKMWHIDYTISNAKEEIEDSNKFSNTDKKHIAFGFEYPILNSYSIGLDISKDWFRDKNSNYSRFGVKSFIRYYW